jgi:sodium-dependent dicarboxylate transporter 2/3/5
MARRKKGHLGPKVAHELAKDTRVVTHRVAGAGRFLREHTVGLRRPLFAAFGRLNVWVRRSVKLLIPFAVLLLFTFAPLGVRPIEAQWMIGIFLTAAIMWTLESLPLPVTSLLIPVLLVLYGIAPGGAVEAFAPFGNPVIFLMMGALMISEAFRKSHLDKRFSLYLISLSGGHYPRLLLTTMLGSYLLSMWISNTATAALLVPVAIGIASRVHTDRDSMDRLALVLLLGIGLSSAIGGMATMIGSSANAVASSILASELAAVGETWSFLDWMVVGLPVSIVLLFIAWWVLMRIYPSEEETLDIAWVKEEREEMGPLDRAQKTVLVIFGGTVAFWVFGETLASLFLPSPFATQAFASAAVVSIISALFLFMTRSLDWEDAKLIPWGIFLIIGAGLALGEGLVITGAATLIGDIVAAGAQPLAAAFLPLGLILALVMFTAFGVALSNVMNNTATASVLIPILIATSIALSAVVGLGGIMSTKLFILPVALGLSVAFITPIATPSSILIYDTGLVTKSEIARSGLYMTAPAILIVVAVVYVMVTLGVV